MSSRKAPAGAKSPSKAELERLNTTWQTALCNLEARNCEDSLRRAADAAASACARVGQKRKANSGGGGKGKGKEKAARRSESDAASASREHAEVLQCGVCQSYEPADEGVQCDAGHYSCKGCVERLLQDSLVRSGDAMSAAERSQLCYHVKCSVTHAECGVPYTLKQLATRLPEAAIRALGERTLQFALDQKLPDAVKAYVEQTSALGGHERRANGMTVAEEEESVRAALRKRDGQFRDERGGMVKQCVKCEYGPVLQFACSDMQAHHGQAVRDPRTGLMIYRQDMSCGHCGFRNTKDWDEWPNWTGKCVLGVSAAPAAAAPPSPRRRALSRLCARGRGAVA